MAWVEYRISNDFWNSPNYTSAILYYVFMQSAILRIGDFKIKVSIYFKRTLKVLYVLQSQVFSQHLILLVYKFAFAFNK